MNTGVKCPRVNQVRVSYNQSVNMPSKYALGWLFAAFYLFFACAFGYFLIPQKAAV